MQEKELYILSQPRYGWCCFEVGDFTCSPSYLTDVMYDVMEACLLFIKNGIASVQFDCEGTEYSWVFDHFYSYIIDDNGCSPKVYKSELSGDEICENILKCYADDKLAWINFANMNEYEKSAFKRYEKRQTKKMNTMEEKIRKGLEKK